MIGTFDRIMREIRGDEYYDKEIYKAEMKLREMYSNPEMVYTIVYFTDEI